MGCCVSTPVYVPIHPKRLPPLRSAAHLAALNARFPPPLFVHLRHQSPFCLVHRKHPRIAALLAARTEDDWRVVDHFFRVRYVLLEQVLYGD